MKHNTCHCGKLATVWVGKHDVPLCIDCSKAYKSAMEEIQSNVLRTVTALMTGEKWENLDHKVEMLEKQNMCYQATINTLRADSSSVIQLRRENKQLRECLDKHRAEIIIMKEKVRKAIAS